MPSTEIALRHVVTFRGPQVLGPRHVMVVDQPLPRNTMDPRYTSCESHHTACVCREAELAEEIHELRWERDHLLRILREELADHATYAYTADNEDDPIAACKCTGCRIVRRLEFYSIGGTSVTRGSERGPTR
ncbi:hypothetical protein [Nonomuraea jabiensis]|uniref:hypothetical protein n=1 Tax=Nonomuraea jabiensis TaxID=882448 RepID=UPI003D73BF98